jgi:6-phosphogluconolactonase
MRWGESRAVAAHAVIAIVCAAAAVAGCARRGRSGTSEWAGAREFGYVTLAVSPPKLAVFSVDPETGAWTGIAGSPFSANQDQSDDSFYGLTSDASGKLLFAGNSEGAGVGVFRIDPATGHPAPVAGHFSANLAAYYVAASPAANYLYVADRESPGTVTVFSFDGASGMLHAVSGSPFQAGSNPQAICVDPNGRFLFVADQGPPGDVATYTVDSKSGALAPVQGSPFAAGRGAEGIAISPSGRFLYVSDSFSGQVLGYSIDRASGALAPIAGSPFTAGVRPAALAIDHAGKFLFVANQTAAGAISVFKIDPAGGALASVAGSPFAIGGSPAPTRDESSNTIAVDAGDGFLYAIATRSSGNSSVASLRIDRTSGALVPVSGSPFPLSARANGIAVVGGR